MAISLTWLFLAAIALGNAYAHFVPVSEDMTYNFIVVTDMDKNARISEKAYKSIVKNGQLKINAGAKTASVVFDEASIELQTGYAYKARGGELSELIHFNNRLFTMDDKTGVVFEILNKKLVPWVILADGNGTLENGFKAEWATVKNGFLVIGSHGVEYINPDGSVANRNTQFVDIITPDGAVHRQSWDNNYNILRKAAGFNYPGYLTHESALWSQWNGKWYFLPRKCSQTQYSDLEDEKKGCNLLISLTSFFSTPNIVKIGTIVPERGYSSFKFVPNTRDQIIIAIKSVEVGTTIESYITVFNINGYIYMEDIKFANDKYEGLAFVAEKFV